MLRLLATTAITLALIGGANARVDMSGVTDVTKAQIRAGLHVYNKKCGGLSASLSSLLEQMEFYETMRFAPESKATSDTTNVPFMKYG